MFFIFRIPAQCCSLGTFETAEFRDFRPERPCVVVQWWVTVAWLGMAVVRRLLRRQRNDNDDNDDYNNNNYNNMLLLSEHCFGFIKKNSPWEIYRGDCGNPRVKYFRKEEKPCLQFTPGYFLQLCS